MSHPPLLPQTVRIKRKRQDEPVETLHVHTQEDSKRRRHTEDHHDSRQESPARAIFRRVQDVQETVSEATASPSSASRQQSLLSSSSRGPSPDPAAAAAASPGLPAGGANGSSRTLGPTGSSGRRILPTPQATRRFHLARASLGSSSASSTTTTTTTTTTGPAGGVVKKKRKNVATLVESKPKKRRSSDEISTAVTEWNARRAREQSGQTAPVGPEQQPSSLKRPGKSSAVSTPRKPQVATASPVSEAQQQPNANTAAVSDPSASANAVDPGLLADMQRFADEVESAEQQQPASVPNVNSFQQQQPHPGTPTTSTTPQKLKFQPKPTPRYRERNPPPATAGSSSAMDIDAKPSSLDASDTSSSDSDSDGDGGDYVYDTYILSTGPADTVLHHAASSAATAATMTSILATPLPPSVGLLIIRADDEPLWEAYADGDGGAGGDAEDEDAFDTDDEDSNAEDWRGNEYPEEEDDDDEVMGEDSDGEEKAAARPKGLGRIEDEEWDARGADGVDSDGVGDGWGDSADDAVWSDEDEERMRRPFAVPGWLKR
ncbi:hypothetical protein IWX90DRAFT_295988 [Phyllosticta citrichinensis]|uniref:Transcription factor Iwr1 domain-containing protein n=1 Tax=Phyllosticta citrichinensis TaxID=1130410 RepID=A0ABR1XKG5_9PEZI